LPARNVVGAAMRCWQSSHEQRRRREPAAGEVFVLPLGIHQMDAELLEPSRIAERGAIFGGASQS
jgi:hypothetical protein